MKHIESDCRDCPECKGCGRKYKKYVYYTCDNCGAEIREDDVNHTISGEDLCGECYAADERDFKRFPAISLIKTGQNIARLRKESGMTVQELSKLFGFDTPQAIYKWQRGVSLPTVDNLVMLSTIFKTSIDEIIILEGDRTDE